MKDDRLLKECTDYFISNPAFKRLFIKAKDKYASLGHIGGSVTLDKITMEEKEAIGGLLRKDYHRQKSAVIRLEAIQKAVDLSKFQGLLLEDILNGYFGETILSNKSIKESYLAERKEYFNVLVKRYSLTKAEAWLEFVLAEKTNAYSIFITQYDQDKITLSKCIEDVCRAINSLPSTVARKMRLPVFAAEVTKDPHAFDVNNTCGKIFLHALSFLFNTSFPNNAEKRAELYYKGGILFDEVSSFVLCKGLHAYTAEGIHIGWEGFYNSNQAVMATLSNIGALTKVVSQSKKVFTVENAGVFAAIADKTEGNSVPIICTNGQLKIAALALLDMLAQDGCDIYYSGDFDPEGLQIADKLSARYGERLHLWRFTTEDYLLSISDKHIDNKRIKKLNSINNHQLAVVAQEILNRKLAGYQEGIIQRLIDDIPLNH